MALGRVLALYDNLIQYVDITSPWGSGDDEKTSSGPAELDRAEDISETVLRARGGAVGHKTLTELTDEQRAFIGRG